MDVCGPGALKMRVWRTKTVDGLAKTRPAGSDGEVGKGMLTFPYMARPELCDGCLECVRQCPVEVLTIRQVVKRTSIPATVSPITVAPVPAAGTPTFVTGTATPAAAAVASIAMPLPAASDHLAPLMAATLVTAPVLAQEPTRVPVPSMVDPVPDTRLENVPSRPGSNTARCVAYALLPAVAVFGFLFVAFKAELDQPVDQLRVRDPRGRP